MARRRFRNKARVVYRNVKSRARRPKRNEMKRFAKKAAMGTAAGLAISIPLTLAGQYFRQPILVEAGQRVGAIAATAVGGTPGETGYQAADAVFDRFVMVGGRGISGSQGQVYL